jgi:two-component system, NtrC family, response regulator AtoC
MQPTKRLILCVEDDDDTCSMLSALLGRAGYEVRTASGVADGLRLAEGGRFDLYILDNWFADGTGLDLCRRIREFDCATPILFFSGLAQESDRQIGLDAGAQGYLIKPNDLDKLVETVTRLIGNDDGEAKSRPAPAGPAHRHQQPDMPR